MDRWRIRQNGHSSIFDRLLQYPKDLGVVLVIQLVIFLNGEWQEE